MAARRSTVVMMMMMEYVLFIDLILIEVEANGHDLAPTTSFHPSSLQILLPHSSKVLQLDNNIYSWTILLLPYPKNWKMWRATEEIAANSSKLWFWKLYDSFAYSCRQSVSGGWNVLTFLLEISKEKRPHFFNKEKRPQFSNLFIWMFSKAYQVALRYCLSIHQL